MKRFPAIALWFLSLAGGLAAAQKLDRNPERLIPGVGSSGGGFAIVCRDYLNDEIIKATLVDLHQVKSDASLIKSRGDLYQDYLEGLQAYLTLANKKMDLDPQEFFRQLMGSIKFVSPPDSLPPIFDLGEEISIPEGCVLEQIAFYDDRKNTLSVKKEVWNHMDTLNQAALLHHEVIYAGLRKQGEVDSKRVRKIVGQIYSQKSEPSTSLAGGGT